MEQLATMYGINSTDEYWKFVGHIVRQINVELFQLSDKFKVGDNPLRIIYEHIEDNRTNITVEGIKQLANVQSDALAYKRYSLKEYDSILDNIMYKGSHFAQAFLGNKYIGRIAYEPENEREKIYLIFSEIYIQQIRDNNAIFELHDKILNSISKATQKPLGYEGAKGPKSYYLKDSDSTLHSNGDSRNYYLKKLKYRNYKKGPRENSRSNKYDQKKDGGSHNIRLRNHKSGEPSKTKPRRLRSDDETIITGANHTVINLSSLLSNTREGLPMEIRGPWGEVYTTTTIGDLTLTIGDDTKVIEDIYIHSRMKCSLVSDTDLGELGYTIEIDDDNVYLINRKNLDRRLFALSSDNGLLTVVPDV